MANKRKRPEAPPRSPCRRAGYCQPGWAGPSAASGTEGLVPHLLMDTYKVKGEFSR